VKEVAGHVALRQAATRMYRPLAGEPQALDTVVQRKRAKDLP
jgi:hypothetical protein